MKHKVLLLIKINLGSTNAYNENVAWMVINGVAFICQNVPNIHAVVIRLCTEY